MPTKEHHFTQRIGWLRAAVLGANDGIVSTASLLMGVGAAEATHESVLTAGVAGLVAGAMSMAAGEYVSVSSQSDSEQADIERERRHLEAHPEVEHAELKAIYIERGLPVDLADEVATQLMAKDALAAHVRDELELSVAQQARPVQAAVASAVTFAVGASVPLAAAVLAPTQLTLAAVSSSSLAALAVMGGLAARAGGASAIKGALRVMLWGAAAMVITAVVGVLFGAVV